MQKFRIFITGGHLTPALAIIEEILNKHFPYELVFIGRKYAMEEDTIPSEEFRIIQELHIRFLTLITGRFRRFFSFKSFWSLIKLPLGLSQSLIYCTREKPDLIISFGGYLGLPVVLAGWILGIPSVTHEQTHKFGLANKLISLISKRVCVTWPETVERITRTKTVITGLPIRKDITSPPDNPSFTLKDNKKLIYIFGGITGSKNLNYLIDPLISKLSKEFVIIHTRGSHWINEGIDLQTKLPDELANRYLPFKYLDTKDHAWALNKARIIISRAGANTIAEIASTKKVAILMPLAWSGGEQFTNAQFLVNAGSAIVIDEENITSDILYNQIMKIHQNFKVYEERALSLSIPNGTQKFMEVINAVLHEIR